MLQNTHGKGLFSQIHTCAPVSNTGLPLFDSSMWTTLAASIRLSQVPVRTHLALPSLSATTPVTYSKTNTKHYTQDAQKNLATISGTKPCTKHRTP